MNKKMFTFVICLFNYVQANESLPTQIELPSSLLELPKIIQNFPEDSKRNALQVINASSKMASKIFSEGRKVWDKDSLLFLKRVETHFQNISQIASSETKMLTESLLNILFLKIIFGVAIYHSYLTYQSNSTGLWYLIFGLFGFIYTQKILDKIDGANNFIQNLTPQLVKHFNKLFSKKNLEIILQKIKKTYKKRHSNQEMQNLHEREFIILDESCSSEIPDFVFNESEED